MKTFLQKFIHKKSSGFTLAEVLITLLIIGVIAGLTIPSIAYSVQKYLWVETMKKTYSNLSRATNSIMQDNGGTMAGAFLNYNDMVNTYSSKMSFIKTCLADEDPGVCYHNGTDSWHTLYGDPGWTNPTTLARAIGNDGVLYRFGLAKTDCSDSRFRIKNVDSLCGYVMFDINGFKGPNTAGRDIFEVIVSEKGLFLDGVVGDTRYEVDWDTYCNPLSSDTYSGITCGQRIMKQGGMDY